ncbi:MAG TPA: hypothetical protein VFE89_01760, partial [Beijerinckiaceae bacterium]|nr:hypothetical protein [Beijerinckiaceae bacterium]
LDGIVPKQGEKIFLSTVTGEPLDGDVLDARYWWRNVREPVLFMEGLHFAANAAGLQFGPSFQNVARAGMSRDNRIVVDLRKGASDLILARSRASRFVLPRDSSAMTPCAGYDALREVEPRPVGLRLKDVCGLPTN